jgi:hypothetical protein
MLSPIVLHVFVAGQTMSIAYLRGVRGCRDLEILRRKAMLLSAFQDARASRRAARKGNLIVTSEPCKRYLGPIAGMNGDPEGDDRALQAIIGCISPLNGLDDQGKLGVNYDRVAKLQLRAPRILKLRSSAWSVIRQSPHVPKLTSTQKRDVT